MMIDRASSVVRPISAANLPNMLSRTLAHRFFHGKDQFPALKSLQKVDFLETTKNTACTEMEFQFSLWYYGFYMNQVEYKKNQEQTRNCWNDIVFVLQNFLKCFSFFYFDPPTGAFSCTQCKELYQHSLIQHGNTSFSLNCTSANRRIQRKSIVSPS